MKLIIAVVQGEDAQRTVRALEIIRENRHERSRHLTPVPPLAEPGEFLLADPVEVQVGGATVFVVPADSLEKI